MVIKALLATMGNKVYLMTKITSYFNIYLISTRQGPDPDKNLQLFFMIAYVNSNVLLRPVTLGNLDKPQNSGHMYCRSSRSCVLPLTPQVEVC